MHPKGKEASGDQPALPEEKVRVALKESKVQEDRQVLLVYKVLKEVVVSSESCFYIFCFYIFCISRSLRSCEFSQISPGRFCRSTTILQNIVLFLFDRNEYMVNVDENTLV